MNCTLCKYVDKQISRDAKGNVQIGTNVYYCRRFPPSAFAVPNGTGGIGIGASFPPVNEKMLCAEFSGSESSNESLAPRPWLNFPQNENDS